MLYIKKNISFKTNEKNNQLLLRTRYLVQINFTFDLVVTSEKFVGMAHFCVRKDQLEALVKSLDSAYRGDRYSVMVSISGIKYFN